MLDKTRVYTEHGVDDVLHKFKSKIQVLLADRVYFEHDVNNTVPLTFGEAIIKHWCWNNKREDINDVIGRVEDGKYDDEMKRYYAYLQAESLLDNLDLLDFNDEEGIEASLSINGIYVYEDDLMFRTDGVIESVDRTFDLRLDVKRLLVMTVRSIKFTGETIDFTRGY